VTEWISAGGVWGSCDNGYRLEGCGDRVTEWISAGGVRGSCD